MTMIESWLKRLSALVDKSALLLILPAFVILLLLDAPAAKALVQWSLFALVIAGVAVIISRVIFPQIDLNAYLKKALNGSMAGATVSAAIITFVGLLILAIVLWAKP